MTINLYRPQADISTIPKIKLSFVRLLSTSSGSGWTPTSPPILTLRISQGYRRATGYEQHLATTELGHPTA